MSSLAKYVRFENSGLEFVVDVNKGLAFASKSAAARMLAVDKKTILNNLEGGNYDIVRNAEIETKGGIQRGDLLSANVVFNLALKYNLPLAQKMGAAGANVYILGLAGYKVQAITTPETPRTFLEALKAAVAAEEARVLEENKRKQLEAQIEADSEATALGKLVGKALNNIRIGEFAKAIGVGQNIYFQELRECNIVMATSTLPYQRYINDGYFVVTQVVHNNKTFPVALVTPKGQKYLAKRHRQYLEATKAQTQIENSLSFAIV